MERAFSEYILDVETGDFPATEHTYEMPDDEWEALIDQI
jgi:ketopantoate hydroxymethyltransferase